MPQSCSWAGDGKAYARDVKIEKKAYMEEIVKLCEFAGGPSSAGKWQIVGLAHVKQRYRLAQKG